MTIRYSGREFQRCDRREHSTVQFPRRLFPGEKMPQQTAFAPFLNVKHALSPTFSADGSRLLYLSDITGTFQVWSVSVNGGWPDQLTFFDDRITGIHSPRSGDYTVISRDEHGNEKDQLFLLQGDAEHGVEITPLVEDW